MLEQLTLVIPSYKRAQYIRRQVEYWRNERIQLLILDGSPKPTPLPEAKKCQVHYQCNSSSFRQRMLDAAELVNTPYVALCGDDDLYLASGLIECIRRLSISGHEIGCIGPSIRFSVRRGTYYAEPINWGAAQVVGQVRSGVERLGGIYDDTKLQNSMYGVYRAKQWKSAVEVAYSNQYSTGYVYEFLLLVLLTYNGVVGVTRKLNWLASAENSSVMNASGFNRNLGLVEWLTTAKYEAEVNQARSSLVTALIGLGLDSKEQVQQSIDLCFSSLLSRYQYKATARHRWKPRQLVRHFLPLIPGIVKETLKKNVPRSIRAGLGLDMMIWSEIVSESRSFGLDFDQLEITRTLKFLQEFDLHSRNL